MKINRIGIGSAAKLSGAMYGAMGLIFGVIFGLASLFGMGLASQFAADSAGAPPAFLGPLFGVGAIILFPLLYGVDGPRRRRHLGRALQPLRQDGGRARGRAAMR